MFNFLNLTSWQNAALNITFAIAFLVGLIWGLSGKHFKWEQRAKNIKLIPPHNKNS